MIKDIFKSAAQLHTSGNFIEAKKIYEKLLRFNPDNFEILQNYAILLTQIKDYSKAENIFIKIIKIKPNDALLLYNYAKFFHAQKVFDKAIEFYKKSSKINPKNDIIFYNLGNIHSELRKFEDSIKYFEKAIEINPSNFLAYNNLGLSHKYLGNFGQAEKFYEKAIEINPDYVEAHLNYSTILLALEKFKNGFREYEWRKKSKVFSDYVNYINLKIKSPIWDGENLTNKTILILSEQGIGDLFQFSRYLYLLKEKFDCEIILRLKHNISHLFLQKEIKTISEKDKIPTHNFHNHLISLPGIFYKESESFPKRKNFIYYPKEKLQKWKTFFSNIPGPKVGINADSTKRIGATGSLQRAIPIHEFKILTDFKNINFFIIQKDFEKKNLNIINKNSNVNYFEKLDESGSSFEDSIGIIKNLDLIITADTSVAHLSATLGKETWIALPFVCDWRWFCNEKKSRWYENVHLYRQKKNKDWSEIFQNIKLDLSRKFKN